METINEKFCKVYLYNPEVDSTKDYDGYITKYDSNFIIKIKSTEMLDEILINNGRMIFVLIDDIKYTFYEMNKISTTYFQEYVVYSVYFKNMLSGIFSNKPNEILIKEFSIEYDNLNLLFSSQILKCKTEGTKNIINDNVEEIEYETTDFVMKILIGHPISLSHDYFNMTTKTIITFNYKKSIKLFDAVSDLEYFISFIAFCSNNIYDYNKIEFKTNTENFTLEKAIEINTPKVNLFAFSHKSTDNFGKVINRIFNDKQYLQFVFNQYILTSKQQKNKVLNADIFSKWVSIMELLFDKSIKKINVHKCDKTIRALQNIIKSSDELTSEQRQLAINRISGIVDNPLREKVVNILKIADELYYRINPNFLNPNSEFINKIIKTRNLGTHPRNYNSNEIFSALEIDKMNCLFKNVVFIVVCKILGINEFGDYYYENIKYFFDVINFEI